MSDIVEQLRDCARDLGRDDEETKIFFWHCGIMRQAANEFLSLRGELDAARERNLLANYRADSAEADAARARANALEEAAIVGYRECAQTRHVRLGDAVAAAIRTLKDKPE